MIAADLRILRRSPFLSFNSADPQFSKFHVFQKGENLSTEYPRRLLQSIAQHDNISILLHKMADSTLRKLFRLAPPIYGVETIIASTGL